MKRLWKILKRTLVVIVSLLVLIAVVGYFYMLQPKFGRLPEGERLAKMDRSPHYKNDRFQNLVYKPTITEGYSIAGELYKTLFKSFPDRSPIDSMPSIKTDLKSLPPDSNLIVWFGHSSFYMQLDGKKFLVDPVFSGTASPIPGSVQAFKGTDIYTTDEMPGIDYVLISHDHYDHLDYETMIGMKDKIKHIVCGLGVGAHFERWGFTTDQIIERDWYEKVEIEDGYTIFTESSHHDGGRGFIRGKALWLSFLIQSPSTKVYYSGDGGRDERFVSIGKRYGTIDWAIMECGQYNKAWQSVHELPEEVAKSTVELNAKNLLPVHHSKFILAQHPWYEPLEQMTALAKNKTYRLATPLIGEIVSLSDSTQRFTQWWKNVK